MIESLLLGAASLVRIGEDPVLSERLVTIPANQEFILETPDSTQWDGVTLFSPEGKALPEIEFLADDGTWEHWHPQHFAEHIEHDSALELQLFTESRTELVVRSPEVIEAVAHFYNTNTDDAWLTASVFNPFATDGAENQLDIFAKENRVDRSKFYSREEWGADERLRLSSFTRQLFSRGNSGLPSEIDDFPTRFKPKIIEDSYDGKPLHWPVAEMPEVYKLVVHHTGEYVDPEKEVRRDPLKTMRAIYYYHTVTLGWGDIGYHYVIDKQGNIYEGRRGGPKAIGAHVAYHNAGSIGISLMGNFNVEEPTDAQLHSLTILLADHADRFGIKPEGRSYYLNNLSNNISGHRDVTARGRGTACPGENLYNKLPELRPKVVEYIKIIEEGRRYKHVTRDILKQSVYAPQQIVRRSFARPEKEQVIAVQDVTTPTVLQRNGTGVISMEVKNNSDFRWPKGVAMELKNIPEGMSISKFANDQALEPGEKGTFSANVNVTGTPNGQYALTVEPTFLKAKLNSVSYERLNFAYPLQVSGDRRLLTRQLAPRNTSSTTTRRSGFSLKSLQANLVEDSKSLSFGNKEIVKSETKVPKTKIKLSDFNENYALVSASKELNIPLTRLEVLTVPAHETIRLVANRENNRNYVTIYDHRKREHTVSVVLLETEGILTIHNYDKGINKQIPFNSFRSDLKFYPQDDQKLMAVNELPLEEYLYGLAEETSNEPDEKRKAILILARSYAMVYGQPNRRKFRTDLYDLEDSPKTSQLYLGYDWERYHSSQKALVDQTKGMVLTHQGFPIIGPYFTQSSGESSGAWKSQYPWAKVQPLPYDKGLEAKGHGVGLSGNSARVLAEKGRDYNEILDYFFTSTEVEKKY